MVYEQTIYLDADTVKTMNYWLTDNTDTSYRLGEDDAYYVTADFKNGIEMDIKCCGTDEGPAWTEAVLFQNGSEVCCTDVSDEMLGDWSLEFENDVYIVHIKEESK